MFSRTTYSHKKMRFRFLISTIGFFLALLFSLSSSYTIVHSKGSQQTRPVSLEISVPEPPRIGNFDTTIGYDAAYFPIIENLFLGLTDYDPHQQAIVPEISTHWEVSEDNLTWIFHLRDDVNWVHYATETETVNVVRPVKASDFVFGIKRACDSRRNNSYSQIIAETIVGCDLVYNTPASETTDDLVYGESIAVSAPDSVTLVITLQKPASHFLALTTLPIMRAQPQEVVEQYGSDWTANATLVSNGPYVQKLFDPDTESQFIRNEFLPSDLFKSDGNIDVVYLKYMTGIGIELLMYQQNELDSARVSPLDIEFIRSDEQLSKELIEINDNRILYFGFNYDRAPFDNIHVRRAFSAIIDRQLFVENTWFQGGIPIAHLTPPDFPNGELPNESSIGFDPVYARTQLSLAGYPECQNIPTIEIITQNMAMAEFWRDSAVQYLKCDPSVFVIGLDEPTPSMDPDYTPPTADTWLTGFIGAYPDAMAFLHIFHCETTTQYREVSYLFQRPCTAVDTLFDSLLMENDPEKRQTLIFAIEEALFGEEGEFPVAPLFVPIDYFLVKPWLTGPFQIDGVLGMTHWDAYHVDMELKDSSS